MAVVFHQPAKALLAVKQQIFTPLVVDAFHCHHPAQIADGLVFGVVQRAASAQWNDRLVLNPALKFGQDA